MFIVQKRDLGLLLRGGQRTLFSIWEETSAALAGGSLRSIRMHFVWKTVTWFLASEDLRLCK